MSATKNFLVSVFIYALILLSPELIASAKLEAATEIYLTTFSYILGAISLWLVNLKTTERPELEQKKAATTFEIISWGVIGFFLVLLIQVGIRSLEISFFGEAQPSQNTEKIVKIANQFPIFLYAVALGGPIMEEFIFRFSLTNYVAKKTNSWFAGIVSSLLFAVAHLDGHYLLYFSMGFCFFLLYKKTGSIYTSIIAHGLMNWLAILAR